jgi:hypothetical protein
VPVLLCLSFETALLCVPKRCSPAPTKSSNEQCPLLAQSGHPWLHCTCPLLGVKRTCLFAPQVSAFDPERKKRAVRPLEVSVAASGRVPREHRLCGWRGDLALPDANAVNNTHSSCAPNRLTPSGGTNADTINAFHACPACFTDSGDHAVRLLNWRKRDRLCR